MTDEPYILVLGTAEWDQPIATNQHYVVRELCRDGFARVDFVESLGLRTPQFSMRDIVRIWGRLRRIVLGNREKLASSSAHRAWPEGLRVISPFVFPFHGGLFRHLNRLLLRRAVREWIAYQGSKVFWTYSPVTYGLENEAMKAFYHCVDLLGMVPGIDNELIERNERRLAEKGIGSAATSEVVQSHLEDAGFSGVLLWKNVADVEKITAADPVHSTRIPGRVIFAGNLAPNKVDFSLLEVLADAGLDVRVAGPHAEGGGNDSAAFESLLAHGVTYLGLLTLPELAQELVKATVGLIPYRINDYTRGVSPLKTFEYLAAGLAVVSTNIPGVMTEAEDVFVVNPDAFVSTVERVILHQRKEAVGRRMRWARDHSWKKRGKEIRLLLSERQ